MPASSRYLSAVLDQIAWVMENQLSAIEKASEICAVTIQKDGKIGRAHV